MKIKKKWVSWEEFNQYLSGGPVTGHTHLRSAITDLPWDWDEVSKTGSNLTDLATRLHASLQTVTEDQHHAKLHASTHHNAAGDAIKLDDLAIPDDNTDLDATTGRHGLLPKLYGGTVRFLRADGSWATPTGDPNPHASDHELSGSDEVNHDSLLGFVAEEHVAESAISHANITGKTEDDHHNKTHAVTHKSAGADSIRIDELKEGTDVTTLDSTTLRHGLLPKLYGGTVRFLRADGTWATLPGCDPNPHASDHELSGSDEVDHDALLNFVAAEHVSLPNTIANVLTDHTKATHDGLSLDHGSLSGKGDDDHTQYYNSTRHTKAVHDALLITVLGSGALAKDHGTASTDMLINACYGTSATPPSVGTVTEGAIYLRYTA